MRGPVFHAEPTGRHARDMSYGARPGSRPEARHARIRARLAPCPEIDCVRHLVPPARIAAAELRASETRTGADRVLVTEGILSDRDYVRALARHYGIAITTLRHTSRAACPVEDDDLLSGVASGIIPIREGHELVWVVAPWHLSARFLIGALSRHPEMRSRLRVTTMDDLRAFVHREAEVAVACRAAFDLRARQPGLSAGTARSRTPLAWFATGMACAALLIAFQSSLTVAADMALALVFLGWSGLRVIALLLSSIPQFPHLQRGDDTLPVYSIIVAVYNEAESVSALVAALTRLDYPKERLDIKIVVECDDMATRLALDLLDLAPPFEIVIAPSAGPRTKPKALNAALPFVRGRYVAVFDAEDRPEPQQLRIALSAFAAGDPRLACVQARLTIDNTADGWLTRLFTAEYAALFDVFLPGLAAWRMPLPLGGTSNHFHTATLRELGGWDPYNVTEDADLGIRLARAGYHTTLVQSSTWEEAPARLAPWIKQRTRWFKGYLQTWAVHMREPRRLWRELGPGGFLVFQLVIGGAVLAALVHGVFAGVLAGQLASGLLWSDKAGAFDQIFAGLYLTTLTTGYLLSALIGLIGLSRRRLLGSAGYLILLPLYWMLLSAAAWRAVFQLIWSPYRWEKTPHGLARTSRRGMGESGLPNPS
ncbi:MAG: glycosyltransferase [Pseudorhodoplanes sp.]|uniref:glycosyltransferase family 2 protein n=1 Tax=Pseudorhodoplanes sp. TaxID=1934341 RepID=UPI003D14346C